MTLPTSSSSRRAVLQACCLALSACIGLGGLAAGAADPLPSQKPAFEPQATKSEAHSVPRGSQTEASSAPGPILDVSQPAARPLTSPLEQALAALPLSNRISVRRAARAAEEGKDGGAGRLALAASYSFSQRCTGRGFGVVPDPGKPTCWDLCLGLHSLGARLCCEAGSCYQGPAASCPLGLLPHVRPACPSDPAHALRPTCAEWVVHVFVGGVYDASMRACVYVCARVCARAVRWGLCEEGVSMSHPLQSFRV